MNDRFFADLPPIDDFRDVADLTRYAQAPDEWVVVLTDVRGSTKAIEAGRYKDVNSLGVASIVAVRNAVPDVDLPFVFGGDGATLLCPATRRAEVEDALRGLQRRSEDAFGLGMRAGIVPVRELREAGYRLLVARFGRKDGPGVPLAMFGGGALAEAERWVKDEARSEAYAVQPDGRAAADFEGFECRWNPIPSRKGVFVSLLVQATDEDPENAAQTYRDALETVGDTLGTEARPVRKDALSLASGASAFEQEARLKSGARGGLRLYLARLTIRIMAGLGRWLLRSGRKLAGFDGANYAQEVVDNTDYRKFDDTLRMVVSASPESLEALRGWLESQRHRLAYGIHTSSFAMMTCIIDGYEGDHLHFVDGGDGGYALAAKQLKRQLKAERSG